MEEMQSEIAEDQPGSSRGGPGEPVRTLALSGASGLLGKALRRRLEARGDRVLSLVRPQSVASAGGHGESIAWDPAQGEIEAEALEGLDAVVHLAGENISEGRWTEEKKRRIRESRVQGTRLLAQAVARASTPPKVFVCASAIGFYGSRGDQELDEESTKGEGFLADVCWRWEAAAAAAREAGVRTVHLRFGMILDRGGGALAKMLPPFRLGAGGRLGSGRQWMSWIHVSDAVGALLFALDSNRLQGPINAVAPQPVRNRDFTRILGEILGRPTIFPMPAFVVRRAFGEMGEELLLASTRVLPKGLSAAGFELEYPDLASALRAELGPGSE